MTNLTAVNSTAPPPSPPPPSPPPEIPPSTGILCLIALITLPMIAYTVFAAMRSCPRNPVRPSAAAPPAVHRRKAERLELTCGVKYRKGGEDTTEEIINEQCPVCLSAFTEGEEIREVGACRHAFHAACVDVWLYSHSSCPVCRAAVPVRRSKRVVSELHGEGDDLRQGLPDAVNLI